MVVTFEWTLRGSKGAWEPRYREAGAGVLAASEARKGSPRS